jgi:DNA-binding IclR family transcriptional regulator
MDGEVKVSYSEVATIVRALRTIEILAQQELSISDLSRVLEVDRGTVSRLLTTLESAGYILRSETSGKFQVAPTKIISLYGLVEDRIELTHLARPILADLRDATNESANVSVLVDDEMMYVAVQRSRAAVSVAFGLGRRVPVHCSAIGKAYTAFLPAPRLKEILDKKGQASFTPRTIATLDSLRAHLERVRQLGYAVDDEESEYGMRCIAAPVRDYTSRVVAALGISGPSTRLSLDRTHQLSAPVIAAAERLSVSLGWEPGSVEKSSRDVDAAGLDPKSSILWGAGRSAPR